MKAKDRYIPQIFPEDPANCPEYRAKFESKNENCIERRNESRLKIEFRERQRKCLHKNKKWLASGYNYGPWDEYLCHDCGKSLFDKISIDGGFRIND